MGALLALAYHYLGVEAFNDLLEELMSIDLLAKVLAENEEKGLAQGRADSLRRYLHHRFGAIPALLEEYIAQANPETLGTLFDRALECADIAELTDTTSLQ